MSLPLALLPAFTRFNSGNADLDKVQQNTGRVLDALTRYLTELAEQDALFNIRSQGGARGNGVTDDSHALLAGAAECQGLEGGVVVVPRGTFRIASSVTIPAGVTLHVRPGGKLLLDSGATLNIQGQFECGLTQAFTGPGSVVFAKFAVDSILPQWWGAKGDDLTDCTTAIQAALNAALPVTSGTVERGTLVRFAPGTYRVSEGLTVDNSYFSLSIEGGAWNATIIKATAAMAQMLEFAGGDTAAAGRMTLRNLTFDGNSLAERGILGRFFRNGLVERCMVRKTTTTAVDVSEGWNNSFVECEVAGNSGDGISLGTAVNNTQLVRTKVLDNTGMGLKVECGPGPLVVDKCDFERNRGTGIFIASGSGTGSAGVFSILDTYFEGNAQDGVTLDTGTYHADIILNGSGDFTTAGEAYSPQVVNIERCLSTAHYANFFVQYFAGERVVMRGNIKTPYSIISQGIMGVHSTWRPFFAHIREGNAGFNGIGSWGHGPNTFDRLIVSYAATMAIDLAQATEFVITATNGSPFTISNPTNSLSSSSRFVHQEFRLRIRNTSGGALGAVTWGANYKMAAGWTPPADGFSNSITFATDSASGAWVEVGRTGDVPN